MKYKISTPKLAPEPAPNPKVFYTPKTKRKITIIKSP